MAQAGSSFHFQETGFVLSKVFGPEKVARFFLKKWVLLLSKVFRLEKIARFFFYIKNFRKRNSHRSQFHFSFHHVTTQIPIVLVKFINLLPFLHL